MSLTSGRSIVVSSALNFSASFGESCKSVFLGRFPNTFSGFPLRLFEPVSIHVVLATAEKSVPNQEAASRWVVQFCRLVSRRNVSQGLALCINDLASSAD